MSYKNVVDLMKAKSSEGEDHKNDITRLIHSLALPKSLQAKLDEKLSDVVDIWVEEEQGRLEAQYEDSL